MKIHSYKNAHAFIDMIKNAESLKVVTSFCNVLTILNEYNKLRCEQEKLLSQLKNRELCIPNAILEGYNLREDEIIFCLEKANSRMKKLNIKSRGETDVQ
ncbi:hypothetical protein N9W84_01255 [bacterium]|nr:hypothetical protein [bacterium]